MVTAYNQLTKYHSLIAVQKPEMFGIGLSLFRKEYSLCTPMYNVHCTMYNAKFNTINSQKRTSFFGGGVHHKLLL